MIWIVERKSSDPKDTDPTKVLLRQYRASSFLTAEERSALQCNSPIVENAILHRLIEKKLCPKIYGIFDGGRVEEFIDSTTLTVKLSKDPLIQKDIAISLARIHMTDVPICKVPQDVIQVVRNMHERFIRLEKESFLASEVLRNAGASLERLANFDYIRECDWLKEVFNRIDFQRTVLSLFDMNFLNCLVWKSPPRGKLRVTLIDYELVGYRPRGFDLSNHLFHRMVDVKDPRDKRSGEPYPSEQERRTFIQRYLDEIKLLGCPDFDENGLDSVDHILCETELCGLLQCLTIVLLFLISHKGFSVDPTFYVSCASGVLPMLIVIMTQTGIQDMILDFYDERKENFIKTYPQWTASNN